MNNRKEFLKYAVHHHGMSSHTVEDYTSPRKVQLRVRKT